MTRRSTIAASCCLLAAACASTSSPAPPTPGPVPRTDGAARRAPVVVAIVVDQLGAWVLDQATPSLSETGGFKRLMREGKTTRRMEFAHAVTDTAPGHAALFTGKPPCETGIFANEVAEGGKEVSSLADPTAKTLARGAGGGRVGASLRRLRVPTVADELRAAEPRAEIVSLSMKDRGALFGGGRAPSAVLYFDPKDDAFVTTDALCRVFPAHFRLTSFADRRAQPWSLLDPVAHAKSVRIPDSQAGEGEIGGFGGVFPHDFSKASDTALATRASPIGDAAVLDLATQAIAHRDRSAPMLLALSFSSHDYASHVFGPESWEERDVLMRLDQGLGALFLALDRDVGPDNWSAMLAADHGSLPLPEAAPTQSPAAPHHPPRGPYVRISPRAWETELSEVATRALGGGSWIAGVVDPYVMLDGALELSPERRARLIDALSRDIAARPGVEKVYDLTRPSPCPQDTTTADLDTLVARSRLPEPMSALYVAVKPGAFFDPRYVPGRGVSHGSAHLYDRTVPLLVRAPGLVPQGEIEEGPVSFERYAATLRALLSLR